MFDENGNLDGLPFRVEVEESIQPPTDSDLRRLNELTRAMERQQSIWFEDIKRLIAERIGRLRSSAEIIRVPEPRPKTFNYPFEDDSDWTEEIIREEVEVRTFNGGNEPTVVVAEIRRGRYMIADIATDKIVRPSSCVGCKNYHGEIYGGNQLICGMHPYGWDDQDCPDFERADND